MATSATSTNSIEKLKRTCIACGSDIPSSAYLCPSCKHAYCSVCSKPIEIVSDTGLCQTLECELYTKPICEQCVKFDFRRYQPDMGYHLKWRQQSWDTKAFWKQFRFAHKRAIVCRFLCYLSFVPSIFLFAVESLREFWAHGISRQLIEPVTWLIGFWFAAWLLLKPRWLHTMVPWIRKPEIAIDDLCPSCHEPLLNRPVRRMTAYELVQCTNPTRFKHGCHPDSLFELRSASFTCNRNAPTLYVSFSHQAMIGESTQTVECVIAGNLHRSHSPHRNEVIGEFVHILLAVVGPENGPDRILCLAPDTVRSQFTGEQNVLITELALPYFPPKKLAHLVAEYR
jgi:hypothetical protein